MSAGRVAAAALSLVLSACAGEGEALRDRATAAVAAPPRTEERTLCEHEVPKDVCTRCDPDLVATFRELGDWCDQHGLPKSHCRQCDPHLDFSARPTVPSPGTKVRLASDGTAREAGIRTVPVERRRFADTIEVVGRLDFDQNRLAQLSSAVEATVVEVNVDIGDEVRAGDAVVVLASAAIGEDQARRSAAQVRVDTAAAALAREQSLLQKGISAQKAVESARSELAAARAQLDGARASLRAAGASGAASEGRYVLTAPLAGTVVAREAVAGRTVSPGQVLVQVADLAIMWALLEVPEAEAQKVRPGQPVALSFEGLAGGDRRATVNRVGASVDPATRTVRGRVDLPNDDHSLKAGLFVRGRIQVSGERDALFVPSEAVQYAEGQPVVFVRDSDAVYLPVPVTLGAETDGRIEIPHGLDPGASVVTTGAFLLKTEILKDSIGAGCCDEGGK